MSRVYLELSPRYPAIPRMRMLNEAGNEGVKVCVVRHTTQSPKPILGRMLIVSSFLNIGTSRLMWGFAHQQHRSVRCKHSTISSYFDHESNAVSEEVSGIGRGRPDVVVSLICC
jgi:hypothetical protein